MKEKLNIEDLIPEGLYCHGDVEMLDDGRTLRTKKCPFWTMMPNRPRQENGYCILMQKGDWEENGFGLLWDQCKECGLNEGDIEDYDIDFDATT